MHTPMLRHVAVALLLIAAAQAIEVGPAQALLIKRRESPTIKSNREGQTLFAVTTEEFKSKSKEEKLVWRREEYDSAKAQKSPAAAAQNRRANLADGWGVVFRYLREHVDDFRQDNIFEVEPEFPAYGPSADPSPGTAVTAAADFDIATPPMDYWPQFNGDWGHLGDDYSQLHSAYEFVHQQAEAKQVIVAILDVGFLSYHKAFPRGLTPPFADMALAQRPPNSGLPGEPLFPPKTFINGPNHGTATSAILAAPAGTYILANTVRHFSGGNPDAPLKPIRIGPTVVDVPLPLDWLSRTGDVAQGFVTAARSGARVLSMSVGGLPSWTLADAVNEAYARGVAMFCASGDFKYSKTTHLKSPWYTAYPAVYENVMAVTGVTAARKSYGLPPTMSPESQPEWLTLGSFGPLEKMNNAIAAWGPNIPWAALPIEFEHQAATGVNSPWDIRVYDWNRLDLDGQGTSANTPQVAAAASLFLALHHTALDKQYPEAWQQVEVVYEALRNSAEKISPGDKVFYGAGFLRAREALNYTRWTDPARLQQHMARNGFYWLRLIFSPFKPLPDPDQPAAKQRAAVAGEVGKFLENLPSGVQPGDNYTQAEVVAIETEISQHVATSADLQRLLEKIPPKPDKAAGRAFVEALLHESLSDPTSKLLQQVLKYL